ncbi:MAG: hypothetical protein JO307_19495 [Bryobacterales bacterium]|nr:hypothetical protein [Bryobacterales bacterium]MBV9400300.1 hypothetical protein [Bryobacterales bacterium]
MAIGRAANQKDLRDLPEEVRKEIVFADRVPATVLPGLEVLVLAKAA